jgi:hypothetical protein
MDKAAKLFFVTLLQLREQSMKSNHVETIILIWCKYISAICSCCCGNEWCHLYNWWLRWKQILGVRSVDHFPSFVTCYTPKVTSETNCNKHAISIYRTAERYDPREGLWVKLASMKTRRGCHALTVLGEAL